MVKLCALFCMIAMLAACACKGNDNAEGSNGGPCYGNGTCDDGLECKDSVCTQNAADKESVDTQKALAASPNAALPTSLQGVMTCLNKSAPKDLTGVTKEEVAGCFEKQFGNVDKYRKKGKCGNRPEVVVSTGPLEPCSFKYEERKPSRDLSAAYPGIGRVNAIFMEDELVGFTAMVARPGANRSGPCASDNFVADSEKMITALGDGVVNLKSGPDSMITRVHDGAVYSIHRTKVSEGYPVERTVFALFVEAAANKHKGKVKEFAPEWFPKREEDIQSAKRRARRVFAGLGSGKSNSAKAACRKQDILGLLGKDARSVTKHCRFEDGHGGENKFKGKQFWKYWPVMHSQMREAESRMKIHGVGPDANVMEVFVQFPDGSKDIYKDVKSTMGKGTKYGCGGRAWVIDDYVMRARPAGKKLNLAFTRVADYDAFSILVPQASVYANWR